MDLYCIHCSERVADYSTPCKACGGDPRVRGDAELIDLRISDDAAAAADLLASLVAGYIDEAPHARPRWGAGTSTPLELELTPIRIGSSVAADVLPAPVARPRRAWRRG
ncbi:MAG TPA: hypothetical protein VM143_14765 [Acidimicrobiales bacterium]|nr:hypothetical protein [Acidimicrobiales bacterium]